MAGASGIGDDVFNNGRRKKINFREASSNIRSNSKGRKRGFGTSNELSVLGRPLRNQSILGHLHYWQEEH